MCVWECPLPLGCQSGRSVWRCCSQCKSTERETQRSTLRLPWAQTHAAWKHLTDTSYDRPVRCVQAQNQIWKPNKWVWTAPLLFYDGHLFQQISLGRRGKSIEKIKHSCLNGHVHTYFFIFPLALSLQNHWPGGINDNGEDSIKFLQICLTCLSIYVICKDVCIRFAWRGCYLETVASVFALHSHDGAVVQVKHHASSHRPTWLTHEVPSLGEEVQSVPGCGH